MDTEESIFRPPYMSFQTFWNFIEELAAKPLPPRVDRSLMKNKSGTDQNNLTMALTSFGLTDDEGHVQPSLASLVATPSEDRLAAFGKLIDRFYAAPLAVSRENGTTADLSKSFSDTWPSIASADTRRKSVTFFLHAARATGIELSVHFPQGRSGSGAPGAAKKRPATRRRQTPPSVDNIDNKADQSGSNGYSKTVELQSGGVVTLTWDVNLADSSDEDEDFVLALLRQLRRYQSGSAENAQQGSGTP